MRRVTGIGGIFLRANDHTALKAWYQTHLGIDIADWGGTAFRWTDAAGAPYAGTTVWSVFKGESTYFEPSTARFMVNYRVENCAALLDMLRAEGCQVVGGPDASEFGTFGWVMDPEGNKIELWEPPEGQ